MRPQVQLLQQKAQAAEAAALNAETVASAAMSAAESAVREEMEAAAVAKSTATALNNVLGELRALGVSFETTDKLERSLEAKGVSKVMPPYCQKHAALGSCRGVKLETAVGCQYLNRQSAILAEIL